MRKAVPMTNMANVEPKYHPDDHRDHPVRRFWRKAIKPDGREILPYS